MIYTVTPNPTLDLGGVVDQIIPNEKNYVRDMTSYPGGNAINAARIIKRMGDQVVATGFIGGGIGATVEILLEDEGVAHQFVEIKGITRVGVTVSNQKTHMQTRVSFPGPRIDRSEVRRLFRLLNKIPKPALAVIGGSLPPGLSPRFLSQTVELLRRRGVPSVVDVPGSLLEEAILARPVLIKPNLIEFQEFTGKAVSKVSGVLKEARRIIDQVPIICVSSVEGGALLITKKSAWFGRTPKVRIRTTVGAGDSMVGAMSARLWEWQLQSESKNRFKVIPEDISSDLLRWGLASACATLTTNGTKLGDGRGIRRFYTQIDIEQVD